MHKKKEDLNQSYLKDDQFGFWLRVGSEKPTSGGLKGKTSNENSESTLMWNKKKEATDREIEEQFKGKGRMESSDVKGVERIHQ